jgi:D-glycero-D-manno-heptose 1,7-bisphosphate phosphatase
MGLQAVFLDRDGVINENRTDHVKSWAEFRFLPGVPEAVARLTRVGVKVFVVSNQAVVNRGMASRAGVESLHQQMVREIERQGGRIEAVAFCPHRPEEECECRKPRTGLLLDLAHDHNVDLGRAALVGDALTDVEAGLAAGCQAVLVLTGRGREQLARAADVGLSRFMVADDLSAATELLLEHTVSPA